jgi:hypothetical protein
VRDWLRRRHPRPVLKWRCLDWLLLSDGALSERHNCGGSIVA